MSRKIVALAALTLAFSALTGCGTTPAATGLQNKTASTATAQDYSSVSRAKQIATDALYRYDSLRDDWQRAYNDSEKDRIEQSMLNVLTRAASDVRQTASYGSGYDARRVYDIADRAIRKYEDLRYRWQQAYGDREKRELINDMLVVLTQALKDVQRVRTGWGM
ncbi:MAG: hypothetical protein FJZ01_23705 [Candidatus Sericytochromatia bacterium]|nr:hypothetical protein [Candidatus Tanganyikabacteria bacterium]